MMETVLMHMHAECGVRAVTANLASERLHKITRFTLSNHCALWDRMTYNGFGHVALVVCGRMLKFPLMWVQELPPSGEVMYPPPDRGSY